MPPSQLKRLKASLRDQGITGPQKSKKEKKSQSKNAAHHAQKASALASIRDGGLAGTVEQFPGGQSRKAVQILVDYIQNGTEPEESLVLLTPIVLTKDNLDKAERLGEVQ